MEDKNDHSTSDDNDAVERILLNLILSQTLVGEEHEIEKGRLSQEFCDS